MQKKCLEIYLILKYWGHILHACWPCFLMLKISLADSFGIWVNKVISSESRDIFPCFSCNTSWMEVVRTDPLVLILWVKNSGFFGFFFNFCIWSWLIYFDFLKIYIYIWKAEQRKEREREEREKNNFICLFTDQMAVIAKFGPGWSQEPGTLTWPCSPEFSMLG